MPQCTITQHHNKKKILTDQSIKQGKNIFSAYNFQQQMDILDFSLGIPSPSESAFILDGGNSQHKLDCDLPLLLRLSWHSA
jgi:hypothetical protein